MISVIYLIYNESRKVHYTLAYNEIKDKHIKFYSETFKNGAANNTWKKCIKPKVLLKIMQ
jgi:hypothetical protein